VVARVVQKPLVSRQFGVDTWVMRIMAIALCLVACSSTSTTNIIVDGGEVNAEVFQSSIATGGDSASSTGGAATGGALATGGMKATGGALATGGRVAATGGANATGGSSMATAICVVTATSTNYVGPHTSCPQLGELYCPCIFNSVSQVTSCATGLLCDACNMCEPKI